MKFGLQHPNFTFDGTSSEIAEHLGELVERAEAHGFDSFWVMDHFHQIRGVGDPQEPILEGWTTIAVLAGLTSRIRLGTLVTGTPYRYPAVLAKSAASLDVLSGGRLIMGVGAAWNEGEAQAYGISFPPTKERMERLEEAVQVILKMWTEEPANFDGKYYQLKGAYCNPKPLQKPHPPILIGGGGERQTLRIVAKYGDACNVFGSPETVRKKLAVLRKHCENVGRDYDSILKTKLGHVIIEDDKEALERRIAEEHKEMPPERLREWAITGTPDEVCAQMEAYREAGIDYMIVNLEAERELEALSLFGNGVVQKFRDD